MTTLRFTKMQGLGNDFVVFDGIRQRVALAPAQVRRACRSPLWHRVRPGPGRRKPHAERRRLPLPDLECRWLRGRAMRQRRPLLRAIRPAAGAHHEGTDPRRDGERHHRSGDRRRRRGCGRHGRAPLRGKGNPVYRRRRRGGAVRSMSAAKRLP